MNNPSHTSISPLRIRHLLAASALCAVFAATIGKFTAGQSLLWMAYFPATIVLWGAMTTVTAITLTWLLLGKSYPLKPPDALIILPWFFYSQELVSVRVLYQPAFGLASFAAQQKLWGTVNHRWIALSVCMSVAIVVLTRRSTTWPWSVVYGLIAVRCAMEIAGTTIGRLETMPDWVHEVGAWWTLISRFEWAWAATLTLLVSNAAWSEHLRGSCTLWPHQVQTMLACILCFFQFLFWGDLYLRSS